MACFWCCFSSVYSLRVPPTIRRYPQGKRAERLWEPPSLVVRFVRWELSSSSRRAETAASLWRLSRSVYPIQEFLSLPVLRAIPRMFDRHWSSCREMGKIPSTSFSSPPPQSARIGRSGGSQIADPRLRADGSTRSHGTRTFYLSLSQQFTEYSRSDRCDRHYCGWNDHGHHHRRD